uniref:Uncharacterized protein n=1 Tax=Anopheles atroparvus TaxID=41427 RepID=A0A182J8G6_ANOAO
MAFKFVLLASLVAVASAGLLPAGHHGAIATSHSTIQHHAAPAVHHVGAIHAAPAVDLSSTSSGILKRQEDSYVHSVVSNVRRLRNDLLDRLGNFDVGRFAANDGVESVMLVGGVVDDALMTVGVQQRVLALHLVSVACFVLALDIPGVIVVDGVRELVVGRRVLFDLLHVGRLCVALHDRGLHVALHDGWLDVGLHDGRLGIGLHNRWLRHLLE